MSSPLPEIIALASRLIAFDTRSSRSNRALADFVVSELPGFAIERLDFTDPDGIEKSALVALRGEAGGCLAFSAHMDTVPPVGWTRDPFRPAVQDGRLYGLGSCDMKGPMAAVIVAARSLPADRAAMLLLTCDEETTKAGARRIVSESQMLKAHPPAGILVVEPTDLRPLRGHRSDVQFTATARGVQAHSSTADGLNANIALIPFLSEMRDLYLTLRAEPQLQDPSYAPPWCDLNIIVDNHGTATNITPPLATCRMKFRYSKAIDPVWVIERVEAAALRNGLELVVRQEGTPPELPVDHPFVQLATAATAASPKVGAFGSDASQFATVAPTLILGPGSMEQAHKPEEFTDLEQLERSIPIFQHLAVELPLVEG
ncbi:M20/M25/M40 family metallo-hydrolase [Methylobacterium sp. J-048]|uniref:M20/M25/M40 family metallo-hydrolase n=1 Tax=Methylobacterium sp. J-048 TaxID=2836635 RepID=UPI001FBB8500|nr:M20/M25/M40 family metallo-hydrolase [Methylobacterium sp. J-048]MCJ2057204.1 M20/M25/M40 family metallo-hydrolase [Methylobacterium sp. J-048]